MDIKAYIFCRKLCPWSWPNLQHFPKQHQSDLTSYRRNLRLISKRTGLHVIFIEPLFVHLSKDWRTYSKFGHRLTTDKPKLESLLVCGTDGERSLIDIDCRKISDLQLSWGGSYSEKQLLIIIVIENTKLRKLQRTRANRC